MKKRYLTLICLFLIFLIAFFKYKTTNEMIINGTKYAISINGTTATNFPEKGAYDVLIDCANANSEWNYEDWSAEIYNITGTVSCNIDFTSREEKKLNDYVIELTGEQGEGQVVNEPTTLSNVIIKNSDYTSLNNNSTYPFSWNNTNKTWTSTNKSHSSSSNISFKVSESSSYKICYTQSSEDGCDYATVYKNGVSVLSLAGVSTTTFTCSDLGALSATDLISVKYEKDGSVSSGSDEVTFYLSKQISPINYRYEGKNPNNYIYFNNELWRIIGVFDSASHGVSNTNLVKIIRNDSLGNLVWNGADTTAEINANNWGSGYLIRTLASYYNAQNTSCYTDVNGSVMIRGECDFTQKGLRETEREMVQSVTWYLGGPGNHDGPTPYSAYSYERDSTKVYQDNSKYVIKEIGLMYLSDYGYSGLAADCPRTSVIGGYGNTDINCASNMWLKKESEEWTITANSNVSNGACYINQQGQLGSGSSLVDTGYAARPVVYLKSEVTLLSGDGSLSKPYRVRLVNG